MHLCINKVTDVMSTVWPFENTISIDLRVEELTTIHVDSHLAFPFFETFAVNDTLLKVAADFYLPVAHFLYALAFDFIFVPHTIVFLLICDLTVFSSTVELAVFKLAYVN